MTNERIAALRGEMALLIDTDSANDGWKDTSITCGELRELLKAAELMAAMEQVAADRRGEITETITLQPGEAVRNLGVRPMIVRRTYYAGDSPTGRQDS